MSILNSYQVLQATEVWVVTGLVIVQGQSVMVRVVACRLVSHMSTICLRVSREALLRSGGSSE